MEFVALVRRAFVGMMRALGLAPVPVRSSAGRGWWPVIRESFTGAWQQNVEISVPSALAYAPVYACTTLIASDIGKLRLRLVEQDAAGIWTEVQVPAFSPVIRKPNHYQTVNKFLEQWIVSKLVYGNAYVLKERDQRGVVVALYVLDPTRVQPLIAPDGAVYYQIGRSELAGIGDLPAAPASEVIHDLMVPLFHPLVGVSPIYACGAVAVQGLKIQDNSTAFFGGGSNPGGVITVPGAITEEIAGRLKESWNTGYTGANVGKVALLSEGMTFQAMGVNAVDAELIDQLKWTVEQVCSCYHVPAALIDSSHQPPYANSEPLVLMYYTQCLQALIVALENALDEGLGLPTVAGHTYGTEFDIDDLVWLDVKAKTDAAQQGVAGGVLSPNEARAKYFGIGAVEGGASPLAQQQYYSLQALAERDANQPFAKPSAATPPSAPERRNEEGEDLDEERKNLDDVARLYWALRTKAISDGLMAA